MRVANRVIYYKWVKATDIAYCGIHLVNNYLMQLKALPFANFCRRRRRKYSHPTPSVQPHSPSRGTRTFP